MLIVGTGAVATMLADRFSRARISFQIFGAPSERLKALEFRYPGCTTDRPELLHPHTRWVVAVKTWQNAAKIQRLRNAAPPSSILVLQNGLCPEAAWRELSPRVVRALSTYGVKSLRPGVVEGGESGVITVPRNSDFASLLGQAGFTVVETENMQQAIWQKLSVNASLNVVATLYDVCNGKVLDMPDALEAVRRAGLEVARVAKALGVEFGQREAWEITREVALATANNVCSTLADVRGGRPTEYCAINGEILAIAQSLGLLVPTLRKLDAEFAARYSTPVEAA